MLTKKINLMLTVEWSHTPFLISTGHIFSITCQLFVFVRKIKFQQRRC